MKKISKAVFAIIAFAIILSMSVMAFADNKMTVEVGKVTAGDGNEIVVPIKVTGNPGVVVAGFKVEVDEGLTLVKSEKGEAWPSLNYSANDTFDAMLWDGGSNDTSNGVIVNMTFNKPAASGVYNIKIGTLPRVGLPIDENDNEIAVEFINGSVTVAGGNNSTTTVTSTPTVKPINTPTPTIKPNDNIPSPTSVNVPTLNPGSSEKEGLYLGETTLTYPGSSSYLSAYIMKSGNRDYGVDLVWESSDASVASVGVGIFGTGALITPGKAGTATITAKTTDGSGLSASCVVNVQMDFSKYSVKVYEDGSVDWPLVEYGSYWQTDTNNDGKADESDAKTPIQWRVIDISSYDGTLTLLADKILDYKKFNESGKMPKEYYDSTLYSWINGWPASENEDGIDYSESNFMKDAFSSAERENIEDAFIFSEYDVEGDEYGFTRDLDKVSGYNFTRAAKNTDFATAKGAVTNNVTGFGSYWIDSTPSGFNIIDSEGKIANAASLNDKAGVRPCIYVKLDSPGLKILSKTYHEDNQLKNKDVPTATHSPMVTKTPESSATIAPTATVSAPTATVSAPTATVSAPTATVSAPTATVSVPTATVSVPTATVSVPTATVSAPTPTVSAPTATVSAPTPQIMKVESRGGKYVFVKGETVSVNIAGVSANKIQSKGKAGTYDASKGVVKLTSKGSLKLFYLEGSKKVNLCSIKAVDIKTKTVKLKSGKTKNVKLPKLDAIYGSKIVVVSSDKTVATASAGAGMFNVTAVKSGSCQITLYVNGMPFVYNVQVK